MVLLREEQKKGMQRAVDLQFADRLIGEISETYKDRPEIVGDRRLREFIVMCFERARRWGLTSDRDLRAFACLNLFASPRFDEYPPFAEVLSDMELEPPARLERLLVEMDEQDWAASRGWVEASYRNGSR
jgi:hypothetical protein